MRHPDVLTVAVSRVDGGVTILRVVVNEYVTETVVGHSYDVTPDYVESLIARYVADGHWAGGLAPTSWRFVPNDYLDDTTDTTYRNAWTDAPGRVKPDTDMPKARELHRETLRDKRANILGALDADYMKADEQNDQAKKRDIAARKQALRDITTHPEIDAAQTPEALKLAALGVLNG